MNPQQIGQFREFSKIYNTMSEICFNQCVWDFGTKEVLYRHENKPFSNSPTLQIRNREDGCAMTCTEKYMKASKELGNAFTDGHPVNNAS